MTGEHLLVGEIRRAHGIRGECLVEVITDRPEAVYAEGRRLVVGTAEGEPLPDLGPLTVDRVRPVRRGLLVRFREIHDRTIAESFRGRTLLIPCAEAEPTGPGEYFVHDLIGLEVRHVDGGRLGKVVQVYEIGAGHLLGIADGGEGGGEELLPFRREIVKEVDLARGVVTVEPPAGWPA